MALSESFAAAVRSLEREHHDRIIQEQTSFASEMFQAGAVQSTQFPQGMAIAARKEALEFVRNAATECETLQNLSDASDFEDAVELVVAASKRLLSTGSNNIMGPALNQMANVVRGVAARDLEKEVRDRLLVAKDKRKAKGKTTAMCWSLLFLQSNPKDEEFLATNREYREIRQALREADYRDQIQPIIEPAVRIRDVFRAMNEHRPQVIHFSGHGNQTCLAFLDDQDQVKVFDGQNLADLIAANDDAVKLVVLNSCDSFSQAQKLVTAVPHVIGTTGTLDDDVALIFSRTFYGAVAHGRSIASSFQQARIALRAEIASSAADVYKIQSQSDHDATVTTLVTPSTYPSDETASDSLSDDEQQLLKAIQENGDILILETDQTGRWVRAGKSDFLDDGDASTSARAIEALDSLVERKLVVQEAERRYTLTGKGWKLKKKMS